MILKRKKYIRRQASDALELTKGFTPEQRKNFSNAMKTMEEFANYILELTTDVESITETL
jgi:hypothetical protein